MTQQKVTDIAAGNVPRRFDVELLIVHPSLNPAEISTALGLEAHHTHHVGDRRKTPKGTLLPGKYPDTRWRHCVRRTVTDQWYAAEVMRLVDSLEPHKAFFTNLKSTGGRASIIIQFLGDGYFGDEIPDATLAKLVDLELALAIECFVDLQSRPSVTPKSQENGAMTPPRRSKSRLFVIVDPEYGRRLLEMEPGWPVWITMSPTNKPVVYSLWQTCPEPDHLTGITGFQFDPDIGPDERFLAQLRTIDVHHGAYSSSNPYTELEVIGTSLTVAIREALSQLGFSKFTEGQDCFVATHSGDHLSPL